MSFPLPFAFGLMTTWVDFENTMRRWVKAGSGLDDAHIIWAEQTGPRPPDGPFCTLRLGALTQVGAVDPVETNYSASRIAGSEIELQVQALRECSLSVQFFTPDNTGDNMARALASGTQAALYLPSIRSALSAAGLSPFDPGPVQMLTQVIGTKFESRALFEVRFYLMLTVSEFTTWIEHCTPTSYMGPPDLGAADTIDI